MKGSFSSPTLAEVKKYNAYYKSTEKQVLHTFGGINLTIFHYLVDSWSLVNSCIFISRYKSPNKFM